MVWLCVLGLFREVLPPPPPSASGQTWPSQSYNTCKYLLFRVAQSLQLTPQTAVVWVLCQHVWNRWEWSTVCVPERVWCVGALVQGCSVPWCRLEQGSHADTAARPICASHKVTITELLTLEALSSHIAVKPLTLHHTHFPKPRARSPRCSATSARFHGYGLKN